MRRHLPTRPPWESVPAADLVDVPPRRPPARRLARTTVGLLSAGALLAGTAATGARAAERSDLPGAANPACAAAAAEVTTVGGCGPDGAGVPPTADPIATDPEDSDAPDGQATTTPDAPVAVPPAPSVTPPPAVVPPVTPPAAGRTGARRPRPGAGRAVVGDARTAVAVTRPASAASASAVATASRPTASVSGEPSRRRAPTRVAITPAATFAVPAAPRVLPPPTPLAAVRPLSPAVAARVRAAARRAHVAWPLVAALAERTGLAGASGGDAARTTSAVGGRAVPAVSAAALARSLAAAGAGADPLRPFASRRALRTALGLGDPAAGRRLAALAAYLYALGPVGVRDGIVAAWADLEARILADPAIAIYPGGRADIAAHRVDPRVLVAIRYLEAAFGRVRVSSLISGHAVFTPEGGVSAHVYGRAVDVTALGGVRLRGHQDAGSVGEQAVRLLLQLPRSVAPRQVVSLVDVDGPSATLGSLALPDHADRISVGF